MKYKRMSVNELIREHKNLVRVLKYGNKTQLKREAIKQKKELNKYKRL
jgi:hypothetical protein